MMLTVFMTTGLLPDVLADAPAANELPAVNPAEIPKPSRYLVVTYFHTTFRCPTCHKIEEYSNEAVRSNFQDELKSGKMVWQVINVEEPEYKHYVNDYQLYSKHLIVSEVRDGKEVRWKDLKEVWTTVGNKEKFEQYVVSEITDWLKEQ
jgi:hypothetical protein